MCHSTKSNNKHHPNCLLSYLHNFHGPPSIPTGSECMSTSGSSAHSECTPSEPCPFTSPPTISLEPASATSSGPFTPESQPFTPVESPSHHPQRRHRPISPATSWTFASSTRSTEAEDDVPISPKTTLSRRLSARYHLPGFLSEEVGAGAAASVPFAEKHDATTPTQEMFLDQRTQYMYHENGNYFLPYPVGSGSGVPKRTEKPRANC